MSGAGGDAAALGGGLPGLEAVGRAAGLSIPDVMAALVNLELRGLVRCVGGRYERTLAASG